MSPTMSSCRAIQPDLVATATGDAVPGAEARVRAHVAACAPCRQELERYRSIDRIVGDIRRAPVGGDHADIVRGDLEWRLAELRRRAVTARVWSSPLGPILIARSEQGVVLVEYLDSARGLEASRALRRAGVEVLEDGNETEAFYQQILEYLAGERTRLAWPLDYRLAASDFHREVLQATATLPYGAVVSYARLAREIGRPTATRAVAQALRHNPLPIVVPCHRVIGGTGALTGYAGDKLALKERLLSLEGVPVVRARRDRRISRDAMYVVADHDREYCVPTCGSLSTLPLWRLTLFATRDRAESAGLAPCTSCRPDLHPLSA
ncbi:MAG: methylated-DNA--[protein]-cysteine S-methyltransferase [Candidatus Rokubacteria bacterium]|nr:methylated-DNA--[protein]-cysteine S-methyltransferase [Candidatus Rokubacteria bacterium]